jgi:hypothetical protein
MRYSVGQAVRLHGPITVQGSAGQVSMGVGASVLGAIAAIHPDGTYDVQTVAVFMGVNYFPRIPESHLSPA